MQKSATDDAPLTLVVPSTSQQANIVDSVASMARKRQAPSMSAKVDQWSMLGLGLHDKIKKKNKQSHGKVEDKGKLSPWRVVQPGAASSTSFVQVPPPLLPRMCGAAPGPVPVVGGVGGRMKLEPPTKFTGKGFPTIRD